MEAAFPEVLMNSYNYSLPVPSIAEYPLEKRDESKLLIYKEGRITDDVFNNISSFLPDKSTLVLNNSRVVEARILFTKATGGVIEIFCLEPHDPSIMEAALNSTKQVKWKCIIGGASKWKRKQVLKKKLFIEQQIELTARFLEKLEDEFIIEFAWESENTFAELLHTAGVMPLPPYIKRKVEELDKERYQTIFAEQKGSVAAPTAALHFTPDVFQRLASKQINCCYTTLHVSAGTFKPVKADTIADHIMHAESFTVSAKTLNVLINSTQLIAVGTTSLRTLESLYWLGLKLRKESSVKTYSLSQWEAYETQDGGISYKDSLEILLQYLQKNNEEKLVCRTSILIAPGYTFRSAVGLITNFHQPRSTLLLLIAAFVGEDWRKIYDHALENNYRFLSYGDSSLLWRT